MLKRKLENIFSAKYEKDPLDLNVTAELKPDILEIKAVDVFKDDLKKKCSQKKCKWKKKNLK